ncbi:prepilin peptidase [Patescibacteria group bacterium]
MGIFYGIFAFLFGLQIGSFLNVVVLRYGTGDSIIKTRSRCFNCSHVLGWKELVPVLSFVLQKGKCRFCKSRISWQYPIVEILTGLVFVLLWLKFSAAGGSALGGLYWLVFFSLLITISVYDIKHKIIPDGLVYALILLTLIFSYQNILAGLGAFAFFAFLWIVSHGAWMGFGDAKLMTGIGLFLGWPLVLLGSLFAFWLGSVWGISLIILKKAGSKSEIPFAPFLVLGAFLAFIFGDSIIFWYASML